MTGTLYGVGLGPGDPDLMTVKATRLIQSAEIIAYPALPGVESMARSIAAQAIPNGCIELAIEIPMTSERAPAQQAYDTGSKRIEEALENGQDVVYLCEGDPFFYGSFMYLHARISSRFSTEIVPGVTSVSAVSAKVYQPLAARDERLVILPATLDSKTIRKSMENCDNIVLMKVGRHIGRIKKLLSELGLTECAFYAERVTLEGQHLSPVTEAPDSAPYFSMVLVRKGADPWL